MFQNFKDYKGGELYDDDEPNGTLNVQQNMSL